VVRDVSEEYGSIGEGEGERGRRVVVSRGEVGSALRVSCLVFRCRMGALYRAKDSPSSSLLDSSDLNSPERLLDEVERIDEVRDEPGECTRRSGSEAGFRRREKLSVYSELDEGERIGVWKGRTSVIVGWRTTDYRATQAMLSGVQIPSKTMLGPRAFDMQVRGRRNR
jgi:hypothetical protein